MEKDKSKYTVTKIWYSVEAKSSGEAIDKIRRTSCDTIITKKEEEE